MALRQDRVADVQPSELVLAGAGGDGKVVDQPVVQRPVILKLQGADRMGDVFDRIGLAVSKIVGRVNAPCIAGAGMMRVQDAIQHRVAQVHVARRHIDLGAQDAGAVGELPGAHTAEQVEVFIDRAIAERAVLAGFGQGAALGAHRLWGGVVHIGFPGADQMFGPGVKLLKVIRRVVKVLAPIEAQPADVTLDGIDEKLLFLHRVRVVKTQMARAAKFAGDAEIQTDRLGMSQVQKPVRVRREAGDDGLGPAGIEVGLNDVADEIAARFGKSRLGIHHASGSRLPARIHRQPNERHSLHKWSCFGD